MTPMPVETFNWEETGKLCRDYENLSRETTALVVG